MSVASPSVSKVNTEQNSAAIEVRMFLCQSAPVLEETKRIIGRDFQPVLKKQPGFIASNIYPSEDCRQLVIISIWRSLKHQNVWASSHEIKKASIALQELIESDQASMQVRTYLSFIGS